MINSLSDKPAFCQTPSSAAAGSVGPSTGKIGVCLTHVGGCENLWPHVRTGGARRRADFKRRARRRALCGRPPARRRDGRPEVAA